ncbi:AhpD family alkylhydroperoxidase [Kitasatospora sp. SolWspMP-SS2h]|uniref:carboxymuconolactone decarboxylase n=1 Tax=Kitasatospora sp. SolWspMP-SS2h TaxID=1305729 RepID=UPI000DBF8756|nr:carboxymuconolactone decarboxylase [Kitasatospora sp. SolWspMP-SS2h]RAJ45436.1 AhpD family alkylhydroperoxidase [Kitasatospora sp. SolWspMP-SS2h]
MSGGRRLVQAPLRGLSLLQVRHLSTVGFGEAAGDTARVYRELERDFGVLAPPVALHAPVPELLAASWTTLRETMLVAGRAPRTAKEAVAAAVSAGNRCPFCTTVHGTMLDSLSLRPLPGPRDGAGRPERDGGPPGPDGSRPDQGTERPGSDAERPGSDGERLTAWIATGGAPPFPPELLPELAGTALCLQYLNRVVNVFLGPHPLPPNAPVRALGPVMRVLVGLMRGSARADAAPGASLSLLPPAPLPPDLAWAAADPRIADALARSAAAVDRVGTALLPARVRAVVAEALARWDGADPGLGRAWLDAPLAELPPGERPVGELALLTALASYRVDDRVVAAARQAGADDREILAACAWASERAARRRVGQLLSDG